MISRIAQLFWPGWPAVTIITLKSPPSRWLKILSQLGKSADEKADVPYSTGESVVSTQSRPLSIYISKHVDRLTVHIKRGLDASPVQHRSLKRWHISLCAYFCLNCREVELKKGPLANI